MTARIGTDQVSLDHVVVTADLEGPKPRSRDQVARARAGRGRQAADGVTRSVERDAAASIREWSW